MGSSNEEGSVSADSDIVMLIISAITAARPAAGVYPGEQGDKDRHAAKAAKGRAAGLPFRNWLCFGDVEGEQINNIIVDPQANKLTI